MKLLYCTVQCPKNKVLQYTELSVQGQLNYRRQAENQIFIFQVDYHYSQQPYYFQLLPINVKLIMIMAPPDETGLQVSVHVPNCFSQKGLEEGEREGGRGGASCTLHLQWRYSGFTFNREGLDICYGCTPPIHLNKEKIKYNAFRAINYRPYLNYASEFDI